MISLQNVLDGIHGHVMPKIWDYSKGFFLGILNTVSYEMLTK